MGVLGGKVVPVFWIPWLGASPEAISPGAEDYLGPQSLLGDKGAALPLSLCFSPPQAGWGREWAGPPQTCTDWGVHIRGSPDA